ncbi:efflux RND transporter periplasmic adaptor subunit [Luteibacter jiangsuensis]|uniref:Efflux RND transporter periplasmic adaptor subunit n=1 Tax=Luteibacter jiangsuensis TaxID=637577 RepID=A0ABX0PYB3_9GAMM|nr:efflux RND transporter periplasmic adaptor subunit [Luteibacter jiangsuensis]NID03345.1 efflux RND transporter periplasmic adaptor subunit [Luteibacter jiangsuensis]
MKTRRRWRYAGLVMLVAAVLALVAWYRHRAPAAATEHPRVVATQPVQRREVDVYVDAIGTVTPTHTVTVRAQVEGTLTGLNFREGQAVKAGDVLATIDDRALRAQVAAAEGALQRDEAALRNAQADLARYRELVKIGSVTQQQVDTQAAAVEQAMGTVRSDRGQRDNLAVQLGYTRVAAPIGGVAGLRAVDVGNLVAPSDTGGIVTLATVSPISVKFAVTEDQLGQVLAAMHRGEVPVELADRAGKPLGRGVLEAVDNRVDTTTGTVTMRAIFPNDPMTLYPNQFVNARLRVNTLRAASVVPARAIQHGVKGDFVFVAIGGKAVQRAVIAGPVDGTMQAITTPGGGAALQAGERVVISGGDALVDGAAVSEASRP